MQRSRVHIMGASGSGTTTLARALAGYWSVPHADVDDYFWRPSDPPFVESRAVAERLALMREVFVPRDGWVLSGSMLGWGDSIVAECDAVVFLVLDPAERLRRLSEREVRRRAGRDYDEDAWTQFLQWARGYDDPSFPGRSRAAHEAWLPALGKPVLRLDSGQPRDDLLAAVLRWEPRRSTRSVAEPAASRDAVPIDGQRHDGEFHRRLRDSAGEFSPPEPSDG